ncbi:hypothetical protein WMY93_007428 [Mugilogobius chulae]|uniref:Uncharacterized protein n=1 Tax=Mugilogobius chulae TaxID=88201 RepID=A0AAW0PGC8_9GOBI
MPRAFLVKKKRGAVGAWQWKEPENVEFKDDDQSPLDLDSSPDHSTCKETAESQRDVSSDPPLPPPPSEWEQRLTYESLSR